MLSGRSTVVCAYDSENSEQIVDQCCSLLGMERSGKEALIQGTEVVPATAWVRSWPGLGPKGELSEYQLVVGGRKRKAAELHAP
eukprot:5771641-Amphidinium_carterae.1